MTIRRRLGFGAIALALGALVFVVASAFVIDRGFSPILAAIVGGLAFPFAPVVWHLLAERGRAKAAAEVAAKPAKGALKPKASTLTGTDRYWMRFVAVALVVIGPMIALARFGVVRAVVHHGLWFVPETPPDLRGIGTSGTRTFKDQDLLLKHVPPDVEGVVVFHDPNVGGNLVLAGNKRHAIFAIDGAILLPGGASIHDKLEDVAEQSAKLPWFDKIVAAPAPDGTDIFASELWRSKVQLPGEGPNAELRRWLARAPQSAQLVAAYVPKQRDKHLAGIAAWLTVGESTVVIEGRAEATDGVSAFQDYIAFTMYLASGATGTCRAAITTVTDHAYVLWDGTAIVAHAEVPKEQMTALVTCWATGL